MLLGLHYTPAPNSFNLCASDYENDGLKISLQNASLYDINSLNWNYAGLSYSSGCWTITNTFRSYGINKLYESARYSTALHYLITERISIGAGYTHQEINYGDALYKTSLNILRFSTGLKLNSFNLDLSVDNITLNDEVNAVGDPEYFLSGSWRVYEELTVFSLYYRNPFKHDRFMFGQNLGINKHLNINAGIMSGPEVYFVGLEVVYKRLVFGYTYYDLAGLPNCSKTTVNFR